MTSQWPISPRPSPTPKETIPSARAPSGQPTQEQYDDASSPSTSFGRKVKSGALNDMQSAMGNVEYAAMGFNTLSTGLLVGGAALAQVDQTTQVALGVLGRRGYLTGEGEGRGAVLSPEVTMGTPSKQGDKFEKVSDGVQKVMNVQQLVNSSWADVRAAAIRSSEGAAEERRAEITAAIAFVDQTLGFVNKVTKVNLQKETPDPNSDPDQKFPSVEGPTEVLQTLVSSIAADELKELNAKIDAATSHAGALEKAGIKEELRGHLNSLSLEVERLKRAVEDSAPTADMDFGPAFELAPTMTADAHAAQAAAATVVGKLVLTANDTLERVDDALAMRLHEPARGLLAQGEPDRPSLRSLRDGLQDRAETHAAQRELLKGST